jgi:hypothetical protein
MKAAGEMGSVSHHMYREGPATTSEKTPESLQTVWGGSHKCPDPIKIDSLNGPLFRIVKRDPIAHFPALVHSVQACRSH